MSENYRLAMARTSHLSGQSAAYVDELYDAYLENPNSVSDEWRQYFQQLPSLKKGSEVSHAPIREYFLQQAKQPRRMQSVAVDSSHEKKQASVVSLINAYRLHGHHHANLDPLNLAQRLHIPDLALLHHQLSDNDLSTIFTTASPLTKNGASLKAILESLQNTYCGSIGAEFMHISDTQQTDWIIERLESRQGQSHYSAEQKQHILQQLTAAEGLEQYLGKKYVGQKRFSLEGGDSLIPLLDTLVQAAGGQKVHEMIMGMAHRGRLNVLVNVLGKSPTDLFHEFEGAAQPSSMSGDVKYHMGFSSDVNTAGGILHLALAFNPSHLEIISPVVEGSVRARQRRRGNLKEKDQVLPIIMHGDAAFAGQGVVMETFNFSQARGYATGGTVHIVINNQIGFTTSNPLDSRSTLYCTDIAKVVQAPIFHVNADDPEAVCFVAQLAFDYRMRFNKDVVIDLVCYRRHGHNEADEPAITQPAMYRTIRQLPTVRQQYAEKLIADGVIDLKKAQQFIDEYRATLDAGQAVVETVTGTFEDKYAVDWAPYVDREWREAGKTAVPLKTLKALAKRIDTFPKEFTPHPVIKKLWGDREKMTAGEQPINWGYAELLAYASLLAEGYPVRISGQDSCRGTFAHRHAVVHDYQTAESYFPLRHVANEQGQFIIIDSVLSEEAVLGFEYGYASAEPSALVIWEAQFGDFVNGAQVVIDQFISSGEQKWGRLCGLVMLLPHGFEGMGPEHSSARLERFLQLCAQHNMQVCVPSTPAQCFHMLRRQIVRPYRKPLVVMTPKSLLRHKLATSTWEDFTNGEFQLVIPEIDNFNDKKVRKVVLCSGKVYYDLLAARRANKQEDVAILRIEQLYPFPESELVNELKRYKAAKQVVWCQEEPKNQGAWYSSAHHIEACLQKGQSLSYAGRMHFAAPAVGYPQLHKEQQAQLVADALK